MKTQKSSEPKVTVLDVAMDILFDKCPRHRNMYLCQFREDYLDGTCEECMSNYLLFVANGCNMHHDPYMSERNREYG